MRDAAAEPGGTWPPRQKGENLPGAGRFAMALGIVSFSVPFAGCVLLLTLIRASHDVWPPPDAPALPWVLGASTGIIVLTSVLMELAVRGARNEQQGALRAAMVLTLVLGAAFLACQVRAFIEVVAEYQRARPEGQHGVSQNPLLQYVGFICLFTGYHALHLIGGLVFHAYATVRAFQGAYRYYHHAGLRYMAMYWHFLGACWLALYVALLLTST